MKDLATILLLGVLTCYSAQAIQLQQQGILDRSIAFIHREERT